MLTVSKELGQQELLIAQTNKLSPTTSPDIAEYEEEVHSPSVAIKIPSVVVLRDYVKPSRSAAFTRFNLFLRDEFSCQYCGKKGEMTFDHVVPKCRGGKTTWENVVAACSTRAPHRTTSFIIYFLLWIVCFAY